MRLTRVTYATWLCLVAAVCLASPPGTALAGENAGPLVQAVETIRIPVRDADRSVQFFGNVLGFELVDESESSGPAFEQQVGVFGARARFLRMRLGDEHIELVEFLVPSGRPMPEDSAANDRWFQHLAITVRDLDEAYGHLRRHKVAHASSGPQELPAWNPSAGGIKAFYFRDPDGHFLELLQFPPGKGNPKWHAPTERLFLGIDHTAIVVRETDASLRFYRDRLGMRVVAESENYGTEQEHLNNVLGARLRITTLRASHGPGVELLEYLAPTNGRPYPTDTRSNDLWNWQTVLGGSAAAAAGADTSSLGLPPTSANRATDAGVPLGKGARGIRDPDGHALELIAP